MLYTATAVAKKLKIQPSEVQILEDFGLFSPVNTVRKEKLYDKKSIDNCYISWNAIHNLYLTAAAKKFDKKVLNEYQPFKNFSEQDLAYLDQVNFKRCNPNPKYFDGEFNLSLLKGMLAPDLVHVMPMIHPSEIVFYKRKRLNNKKINMSMESEAVIGQIESKSCENMRKTTWRKQAKSLVEGIDEEVIDDLANNAGTITTASAYDWQTKIEEMKDIIRGKTQAKGNFWVLMRNQPKFETPQQDVVFYTSNFVSKREILVGLRGESDPGYMLRIYCLAIEDIARKKVMTWYGKKLLREGSKFFGKINLVG